MGERISLGLRGQQQMTDLAAPVRRSVNWQTVAAVVATVVALLAWFGFSPRSVADQLAGLTSRVTTLEANRTNDAARMERIENKVDEILEKLAK